MTKNLVKKKVNSNSESMVTDFGNRTISSQNFSKIVALPKTALINCGLESQVNVKLVQNGKEKFLKLSPSTKGDKRS